MDGLTTYRLLTKLNQRHLSGIYLNRYYDGKKPVPSEYQRILDSYTRRDYLWYPKNQSDEGFE